MRVKNTIVINGKVYDAITGLPAGAPDAMSTPAHAAKPTVAHQTQTMSDIAPRRANTKAIVKAKSVHRQTQRSQTLRRDLIKHPAPQQHAQTRRKPTPGSIATSPHISKFAPHPQPIAKPAVSHATVSHQAEHKPAPQNHHKATGALSSRELKEKLIAERLAAVQNEPTHAHHAAPKKHNFFAQAPRVSSVLAGCFAIVLIGGYLTYINMPNLSMRVAAAQAGVDASFPDYRPDGYRFDGPIAYNNGEVSLKFTSNTNTSGYTINQKNSSWDSQAVLDNYVSKKAKEYLTYSEQGLTIYTFKGEAAWVNGGVFYTISGDAPLSSDQVLRIVGSM